MNCLEFRREAGAQPHGLSRAALAHLDTCTQCAEHLRQLLAMDAMILKALQVPVPGTALAHRTPGSARPAAAGPVADRRRWYALAASVVGGVLVGILLWSSGSRDALAQDVLAHLAHEPGAMVATQVPADTARVQAVLQKDGLRLRSAMGLVSYAQSCPFRGHVVPHLVVQTSSGPVTVLVLREEHVRRPLSFHEGQYVGTIEPAGPGSIAVIGGSPQQVREAAERVMAAVEWLPK